MNSTDEFILDAFKQQGMLSDEILAEITAEVEAEDDGLIGGKELAIMNGVLAKTGMPESEVVSFLASELNMDAVDVSQVNPTEDIIALLTPEWARQYEAFPIGATGAEIEIVFGNPLDQDGFDNLTHLLGKSINPKVAYRGSVLAAIDEAYGAAEDRKM